MGKCIRINGPKNKNTDLIRFKTSEELWRGLWVDILPEYRQNISDDEYFTYDIGAFDVDIGDNGYGVSYYSFYKNEYNIKITKTEIEEKLGEPYNTCRQSTEDEIYNQADCIEKCVNTELANKYNCTWYGYNEIEGLEYCKILSIRTEFKMKCRGESPKNCATMKFITELTRGDQTNLNYTKFSHKSRKQMNGPLFRTLAALSVYSWAFLFLALLKFLPMSLIFYRYFLIFKVHKKQNVHEISFSPLFWIMVSDQTERL